MRVAQAGRVRRACRVAPVGAVRCEKPLLGPCRNAGVGATVAAGFTLELYREPCRKAGTLRGGKCRNFVIQKECAMKAVKTVSSLVVAILLMAGCAFTAVKPGMSREEVMAHYGKPSRVLPLGAGTRLQYSTQPAGQTAGIVDLDAAGKGVTARQGLNRGAFSTKERGKWGRRGSGRGFGGPGKS